MGRALPLEAVAAFGLLLAPQAQTGSIRGAVVAAETGEPVAFSIVSLRPTLAERFTDRAGTFAFVGLSAGIYHLAVRQIGYAPAETTLVVREGVDLSLRIELSRLGVVLPPITVTGTVSCDQPGPPDPIVTPALAAVFDQLLENARRYRLLADSFPFSFVIERWSTLLDQSRQGSSQEIDTLTQTSAEERVSYRPGAVVVPGTGSFRNQRVARLPGLDQFADSTFVYNHCFRLAGRDTMERESFVRIDFEPAARLRSPDVAGAAYLDSVSYQLRYTRVHLTRPERAVRGVLGLVATTRFREIVPGIVLHDRVRAVTTLPRRAERIEDQRLLLVQFVRPFLPR